MKTVNLCLLAVDWSGRSWPVFVNPNLWIDSTMTWLAGPLGFSLFLLIGVLCCLGWPADALSAALHSLSGIWTRSEGRNPFRRVAKLWREKWSQNRQLRERLSNCDMTSQRDLRELNRVLMIERVRNASTCPDLLSPASPACTLPPPLAKQECPQVEGPFRQHR